MKCLKKPGRSLGLRGVFRYTAYKSATIKFVKKSTQFSKKMIPIIVSKVKTKMATITYDSWRSKQIAQVIAEINEKRAILDNIEKEDVELMSEDMKNKHCQTLENLNIPWNRAEMLMKNDKRSRKAYRKETKQN